MKSMKKETMEGMELLNNEIIRTLGENKIYKYLRIFEADTINQTEKKEKVIKGYLRRIWKLLETKHCHRNPIKGINPWEPHFKILGTIIQIDKRGTQTNRHKNKKIDDRAQEVTSKRWHRFYVSRKTKMTHQHWRWLKDYIKKKQRKINHSRQ